MLDVIPEGVFREIQKHLEFRGNIAHLQAWESASADEDSITGDLGAQLRTSGSNVVWVDGAQWSWRVNYKKFRGRGPGALEHEIGSDGMIYVEVTKRGFTEVVTKGLLFQAKKRRIGASSELIKQVEKMEGVAPSATAVFHYAPGIFSAIPGTDFLRENRSGARGAREGLRPLGTFLSQHFLPCTVGRRGMYFDGVRQRLFVPYPDGLRSYRWQLGHKVTIEVVG